MSLKSKDIKSYFGIELSTLIPGKEIPFNIHIYLKRNNHLMVLRGQGEIPSTEFIESYKLKGIQKIWIYQEDLEAYEEYLKSPSAVTESLTPEEPPPEQERLAQEVLSEEPSLSTPPTLLPPLPPPITQEQNSNLVTEQPQYSERFRELMKEQIPGKRETALLAKTARNVLKQTFEPSNLEVQIQSNAAARKIVRDILDHVKADQESLIADAWKMSDHETDLVHSTNVATYAVLLAIAFGNTDRELIADLALAGLLHDVGLSQVSASITSAPWNTFTAELTFEYGLHVDAGLEIIDAYGPQIRPRVKMLIQQHHEKFNGTGYPGGLKGFSLDGIVQLLSIAELLDSVASGQWDGTSRTYREAIRMLEQIENTRTFPEYFNPEIFSAVLRWTELNLDSKLNQSALDIVNSQSDQINKNNTDINKAS